MIEKYLQEGRNLLNTVGRENPVHLHRSFSNWDEHVSIWLDEIYPNTGISGEWSSISSSNLVLDGGYYDSPEALLHFKNSITKRLKWLSEINKKESAKQGSNSNKTVITNKVFIVHGHDEVLLGKITLFLQKLNLKPIILHEQPNRGKTIIEKFIEYSEVSFAIVLLTGDDKGGPITEGLLRYKLRARQNVILELGFFLGKLGRDKVCALYHEGVEIPSDYNGVLFIPLDKEERWKFQLARELKTAGIPIDLNELI